MNLLFKHPKFVIGLLLIAVCLSAVLWRGGKAYAAPDDVFPKGATAFVSKGGYHSEINAPRSWFEVTAPDDLYDTMTITIKSDGQKCTDGAAGVTAEIYTKANDDTSGFGGANHELDHGKSEALCKPGGDIVLKVDFGDAGHDKDKQFMDPAEGDDTLVRFFVLVRKTDGDHENCEANCDMSGIEGFRVAINSHDENWIAKETHISYAGDSGRNDKEFDGSGKAFGIYMGQGWPIPFQPTCDYDFSKTIRLKWKGAGINIWWHDNSGPHRVSDATVWWELLKQRAGKNSSGDGFPWQNVANGEMHGSDPVPGSPAESRLGGWRNPYPIHEQPRNEEDYSDPITLQSGYRYKWVWHNVQGPMMLMAPFSSTFFDSGDHDCNKDPKGHLNFIAGAASCKKFTVDGYDPDNEGANVKFRLKYSGNVVYPTSGNVYTSENDNSNRTWGGLVNGRSYALELQDNQTNAWKQVDTATAKSCGSGAPTGNMRFCHEPDVVAAGYPNNYKVTGDNPGSGDVSYQIRGAHGTIITYGTTNTSGTIAFGAFDSEHSSVYYLFIKDNDGDWVKVDAGAGRPDQGREYPSDCPDNEDYAALISTCSAAYVKNQDNVTVVDSSGTTHTFPAATYVTITNTDSNVTDDPILAAPFLTFKHDAHTYEYNPVKKAMSVSILRIYRGDNGKIHAYRLGSDGTARSDRGDYSGEITGAESTGNADLATWVQTQSHNSCYHASCTVNSIDGLPAADNRAVTGQNYRIYFTVTNDNTDPEALEIPTSVGGYNVSLSEAGQLNQIPANIPVGQSIQMYVDTTAPDLSHIPSRSFYPDILNSDVLGGTCSTGDIPVYGNFHLHGHNSTSFNPDNDENPSTADAHTWVTSDPGYDVYAPTESHFTKDDADLVSPVNGGIYPGGFATRDQLVQNGYPLGSYQMGTKYCTTISLDYTTGYVNRENSNDVVGTNAGTAYNDPEANPTPACRTIKDQPYAHFFGSDVSAGGEFGNSNCSAGGDIYAYHDTGNHRGTGAQFGVEALGVINGMRSTNLRTSVPNSYTGLTFGNSGNAVTSPNNSLGGKYGVANNCAPEYYDGKVPSTATDITDPDPGAMLSTITTPGQYAYKTNSLSIGQAGADTVINEGVNAAIYVNGDVFINGNIRYSNSSGWTSIKNISSLFIIAKGHIYISGSVTGLDGAYIAEPTSLSNSGTISTCKPSMYGSYNAEQVRAYCDRQLQINGAFVAKRVQLDRSFSSLRYGHDREYINTADSYNCGVAGLEVSDDDAGAKPDCAAEIFNYSPELLLSRPATDPVGGPSTGKYDYITSLAPVL